MAVIMSPVKQRDIALTIYNAQFQKNDFEFDFRSNVDFTITFVNEPSYYFKTDKDSWYSYSPGREGSMKESSAKFTPWASMLEAIKSWLLYLRENVEIGDPWQIGDFQSEGIHIGKASQDKFSVADIDFIEQKLDVILEALKEFAQDFAKIKDDLEYLKGASEKVSKKDWGLMVMGNVMGWAMGNAIPKDSVSQVWHIILQNLGNQNLIS